MKNEFVRWKKLRMKKRPSIQRIASWKKRKHWGWDAERETIWAQKVKVKVAHSCPTLCHPMNYTVHGVLQARILEWVAFPFSRGSSQPRSPTLQVDSLPAEPQGKPKNTGVDSLSLLQRIFLTQKLNRGLLALQADSLPTELCGNALCYWIRAHPNDLRLHDHVCKGPPHAVSDLRCQGRIPSYEFRWDHRTGPSQAQTGIS